MTHWWKVLPLELSWMSSVISLLEFLLSPRGKRVTDWCKFLPEPPHVPSICILQWTDTVSAPRYFILRPLKSCWETRVRKIVSGICVLGWEEDLVSRDVGLLSTLWNNIVAQHTTILKELKKHISCFIRVCTFFVLFVFLLIFPLLFSLYLFK